MHSILTYSRFLGAIKPDLIKANPAEFEVRLACLKQSLSPATLRVPVGRRILAISPHPDDETIGAGGLLLAHSRYAEIFVLTIFNGDGGGVLEAADRRSPNYKSRLVEARRKELHAACAHFSGRVIGSLGLSDGQIPGPAECALERLRDFVQSVRPDVVILPWLLDNHADHRTANLLWAKACADVSCMILGTRDLVAGISQCILRHNGSDIR